MADPYREEISAEHAALLADERAMLVSAGKIMVVAGVVGLLAVLAGASHGWVQGVASIVGWTALPGLFAALTLQAGLVLSRLPGGSRDYSEIDRAVGSLHVLYAVKGVVFVAAVALYAAVMLGALLIGFFG